MLDTYGPAFSPQPRCEVLITKPTRDAERNAALQGIVRSGEGVTIGRRLQVRVGWGSRRDAFLSAERVRPAPAVGALLEAGACGTTPDNPRALRKALDDGSLALPFQRGMRAKAGLTSIVSPGLWPPGRMSCAFDPACQFIIANRSWPTVRLPKKGLRKWAEPSRPRSRRRAPRARCRFRRHWPRRRGFACLW